MACIGAETGTLIFAVFNIIVVTLSTAISAGTLVYFAVACASMGFVPENVGQFVLVFAILISWISVSLLTLVFSSFLLNGSLKKKPEHIKPYFVYGVIVVVISSIIFTITCVAAGVTDAVMISSVIVTYAIYCLILHMVRHTYVKLETINNQFGVKPLVEKC